MKNFYLSELTEDFSNIQLLRTGKFNHPDYGNFEITKEKLKILKETFDKKVRKVDLAVDFFHKKYEEAAGWIRDVFLSEDGESLHISVDFTESAKEKIKDRQVRYISADYVENYTDSESGEKYEAVLMGAGLTNRPFVRGMQAILSEYESMTEEEKKNFEDLISTKKESKMDFEDLKAAIAALSDEEKGKIKAMFFADKQKDMSEETAALKGQVIQLTEQVKKTKAELEKKEKEIDFDRMLSEGNAVEAQRDAWMSGDIRAFAEKSVSINLHAKGNGQNKDDAPKTAEEAQERLNSMAIKLSEEKSMNYAQAATEIIQTNTNLAKLAGYVN